MESLSNIDINNITDVNFKCSCGKIHNVDIKNIFVRSGAINELESLLDGFEKVFIIGDKTTYAAVEEKINPLLKKLKVSKYIFKEKHLYPDLKALGRIIVEINKDTEIIIAVGSGTINDLTRMLSDKLKIPYIILAAAPSMDGYASNVSPIIVEGIKSTYSAVYPSCIIGDLDILSKAPINMVKAGIGDILGKYTALSDWKISKILNNEYYCDSIAQLVRHSIDKCITNYEDILARDAAGINSLTQALIFSGVAIGMAGSSRPASGEEHHLSHCWEAYFIEKGEMPGGLHGNYVGAATSIVIEAYKFFMNLDLNKIYNQGIYLKFNEETWVENIRNMYKTNSDYILNFKKSNISFAVEKREERVEKIIENAKYLKEVAEELLEDTKNLKEITSKASICYNPAELNIDKQTFIFSVIAAKDIRNRYGIFQLLEDLGVLEEAAYSLSKKYYD